LGFRLITLLCVEYKLYTHILNETLLIWALDNKVLPPAQNGALSNKGCDTCLWALLTTIQNANHYKHPIHVLYIDFCKAFDSVEHWTFNEIFKKWKLGHLGEVIISLLQGSCTSLKINGVISSLEILITRGTKQGDVISPLLFIIFLSPLLWTLERVCKGYANKGTVFKTAAIIDDVAFVTDSILDIEMAMRIITDFSQCTGIDINPKKSAYTAKHSSLASIKYKDNLITIYSTKDSYRYLGLWVNLDLCWNKQLCELEKVIHIHMNDIFKKFYIPGQLIARAVNTIIYSKIGYRMQVILFPEE
jgi:hypothetical protein